MQPDFLSWVEKKDFFTYLITEENSFTKDNFSSQFIKYMPLIGLFFCSMFLILSWIAGEVVEEIVYMCVFLIILSILMSSWTIFEKASINLKALLPISTDDVAHIEKGRQREFSTSRTLSAFSWIYILFVILVFGSQISDYSSFEELLSGLIWVILSVLIFGGVMLFFVYVYPIIIGRYRGTISKGQFRRLFAFYAFDVLALSWFLLLLLMPFDILLSLLDLHFLTTLAKIFMLFFITVSIFTILIPWVVTWGGKRALIHLTPLAVFTLLLTLITNYIFWIFLLFAYLIFWDALYLSRDADVHGKFKILATGIGASLIGFVLGCTLMYWGVQKITPFFIASQFLCGVLLDNILFRWEA